MANHLYGYNPSYGGPGAAVYSSKSAADPYISDSSILSSARYLSGSAERFPSDPSAYSVSDRVSSLYLSQSEGLRLSSGDISGGYLSAAARISGSQSSGDPVAAALKRPTEALYHQTLLGSHNTIGQTEAWFSTNSLAKRPRFETASNLPIYPQRPGEKDCAHYMLTRTCKFADSCKFDHPIWVPEGGIPDWKEVPLLTITEYLPERPGEPDCPYFLKTQKCKFGLRCKFNHPKDKLDSLGTTENVDVACLPERPSEPPCSFYMKTGKCKFGGTCKFHHPKDIQVPTAGQENSEQTASLMVTGAAGDVNLVNQMVSVNPALMHNSKGLPVRLGEVDCPFYMKTGSCKYGPTCRYNHPDRYAINPPAAAFGHAMLASPATLGAVNPVGSFLQTADPRMTQTMLGLGPTVYPQRPGQIECDFYMKTGACKFGEQCKFHHPLDRSAPTAAMLKQAQEQNVKLTLAGLPRREGAIICPYYMKTGTCSFGATCKFDHPPPGEVMAMATTQGTSASTAVANGNEKEAETQL